MILYDRDQGVICLDPSTLSKSISLFLASESQFLDGKSGKEHIVDGLMPLERGLFYILAFLLPFVDLMTRVA